MPFDPGSGPATEARTKESSMLDVMRKGQRWLTLLFVSVIGAVFVFFMGAGGGFGPNQGPSGNAVVQLGEVRLGMPDFQRLRAQQEATFREQMGEQFDARTAAAFLDSQALRLLVESAVLAESASDLGMEVSREEIQRIVRQSPGFRNESGQFDVKAFESYAQWEYGSQRNFLASMRRDLLRQKMVGLLWGQVSVSEGEGRDAALYGLEQVRIAWVGLDKAILGEDAQPDDATVQAYLEANRDALTATFEERSDEFQIPEKVHARHILISLYGVEAEERIAATREQAEAVRARIAEGEDFAEVAKEVSQDAGSKDQGGDLGFFARGENEAVLEDAAFALSPGDLSDVVQSDAGFHVIQLVAREDAVTRGFDDVGLELAREAAEKEAAETRAHALADELSGAVAGGQTLEDAARAKELTLERTGLLRRRPDGFVPGLGGAPDLLDAAFGLGMEAPSAERIFEVGTRLVLIQLLERTSPSEVELEDAIYASRDELVAAKRNKRIQDWVDQKRSELEKSGELLINAELVISGT
jgi:peptidyl-prolyl cis-trans isomerase D